MEPGDLSIRTFGPRGPLGSRWTSPGSSAGRKIEDFITPDGPRRNSSQAAMSRMRVEDHHPGPLSLDYLKRLKIEALGHRNDGRNRTDSQEIISIGGFQSWKKKSKDSKGRRNNRLSDARQSRRDAPRCSSYRESPRGISPSVRFEVYESRGNRASVVTRRASIPRRRRQSPMSSVSDFARPMAFAPEIETTQWSIRCP